ncbi:MAG: DUF3570 domain-containing protein [Opitutaceae bacterium]
MEPLDQRETPASFAAMKEHQHPPVCLAPHAPPAAFVIAFAILLLLAEPENASAETSLQYKWEDYHEEDGRIDVVAHYVRADVDLGTVVKLSVEGVEDVITGATPTGQPIREDGVLPMAQLIETRHAIIADLTRAWPEATTRIQYARSNENDYLSNGFSGSWIQEFNGKNTQLQLGFSYIDDDITPDFFAQPEKKISRDFLIGVTQILDASTTITINYSHGHATGFLSDPYKLVQKTIEPLPGLPLALTFPENRPDERDKDIFFAQVARYFENLRGSAESSFRYYRDDHGIRSGTIELAWFQRFGSRVVVRPNVRWYRQTAADYYHVNLDATTIMPVPDPDASMPFYSSDYRLSEFDGLTFGMKVVYKQDDRWAIDAAFERYSMHGRDETPGLAYITANTLTLGMQLWF